LSVVSRSLPYCLALCLALAVMIAGCDSSGVGRIVPVKGQVTYEGKPVTSGSLVFKPDSAKGNKSTFEPAATIGADGSYSLFVKEQEGAPLGWYHVGVVAQEVNPNDPYAQAKSLIPARYNDAATSGLAVEVVEAPPPGAYDLKLAK
jgi:hypothetical protein